MKLDKIKDKENIWKASRENKHITSMGILKSFSADFSAEALQARREWHDILNEMKGKISNQDYSTQQGFHSDLKEKAKALQTNNSEEPSAPLTQIYNKY